jgi:hypothetical protein
MSLWPRHPDPDSIRLGRLHEAPCEVHYSSGSDRWWYAGFLRLTETRAVREGQFSPHLQDPRNAPVVRDLEAFPTATDEEAAQKHGTTAEVICEVRNEMVRRNEPHTLRLYSLDKANRDDEKVFGTLDQDLVAEAPTVPYSETEKGARRSQWAILVAAGIIYAVFLYATFTTLTATIQIGTTPEEVAGQIESSMMLALLVIAAPAAAVGMYLWMARRTRVLDLRIQPIRQSVSDTECEIVCLTESQKSPAPSYLTHLFRLKPEAVEQLTESFKTFQTGLIDDLQAEVRSLRRQLTEAHSQRFEAEAQDADSRALGYRSTSGLDGWSLATVVLLATVVAVVVGLGVFLAMGG